MDSLTRPHAHIDVTGLDKWENQMRLLLISILSSLLLTRPALCWAEEVPEDLTPLIRFYNEKVNEHAYSSDAAEQAAWRVAPKVKEHLIIGMVSSKELPGTVRLWRGIRTNDKRHIYYTQAPKGAAPMMADNENFQVYVWKKGGDGRIPVYGSTWIDSSDVFFDCDRANVQKFFDNTKKALNVERRSLGQLPVFYVYPPPEEVKAGDKQ